LSRVHARDRGGWHVVVLAGSAEIQMRTLLPDIVCVQQDFSRQFFLESEAPGLLIRSVPALALDRTHGRKYDVVERPQRIAGSRCDTAGKRRCELTGGVAQRVPGRGVVNIEGREPWRLNVISLEAPWTSSRSAAAWRGEINAIAAANHERVRQLIGKPEPWLDILVVGVVGVAITRTGKDFNTVQGRKSGHLERRQGVR